MGYKLAVEKKHRVSKGGRGKAGRDGLPTATIEKGVPYGRQLRTRYVEGPAPDVKNTPAQRLLMAMNVPFVPRAGGRSVHYHATRGYTSRAA